MDLKDYRLEMDAIDDELVALFVKRMEVAARIADYKKENDLPILAPAREREKHIQPCACWPLQGGGPPLCQGKP